MHSFQGELRRTLLQYALAPVIVLAILGMLLGAWSWQHDVRLRSEERGAVAAEVLGKILQDYQERLAYVAEQEELTALRQSEARRRALYEWLYHEVNIAHDQTQFFLLAADGELLLSSRNTLPAYLANYSPQWGIWARLQRAQGAPVLEFSPRQDEVNSDLIMGRAIVREGVVQGYLFFVLSGNYLAHAIQSPYLDLALVDGFGHALISTNQLVQAPQLEALPAEFSRSGQAELMLRQNDYYVTQRKIAGSDFAVYTLMSVGALKEKYQLGALSFLLLLLVIIPVLYVRVRQESSSRARAVDELLDAFAGLKHGDMQHRLELEGHDFAIVAEEYNRMLGSLEQLMEQNKERAKANAVSEVRQLEAQFHPHFIFNTLENIKFMVKLNPNAAMDMIVKLSSILRYGINNLVQEVSLAEEWKYTTAYLDIMQYRYGKRLQVTFEVPEDMESLRLPKLIFQPILENAIKYGEAEDGTIDVKLEICAKAYMLLIRVTNGGRPMPAEQMQLLQGLLQGNANPTTHTGIFNVHRRLRLIYGEVYGLTLATPEGGGTVVELRLPLLKA